MSWTKVTKASAQDTTYGWGDAPWGSSTWGGSSSSYWIKQVIVSDAWTKQTKAE